MPRAKYTKSRPLTINQHQRLNRLIRKEEKVIKTIDDGIKENKEKIKKMKISMMWWGWIVGSFTITLITIVVAKELTSNNPNLLVLVIDAFALVLSVRLIYQSFKARREIHMDKQKEILAELEREE